MNYHSLFANRLTQLRKERGLTQEEIANIIGISNSAISLWEAKKKQPTLMNIIKLCIFFNVSPEWLLGITNDKTPYPGKLTIKFKNLKNKNKEKEDNP